MKKLTREQIERLANKYGSGVEGLTEDLEANLRDFIHSDSDEGRLSLNTDALKHIDIIIPESTDVELLEGEGSAEERIMIASVGGRPVARIRDNQVTTEFIGNYPYNQSLATLIKDNEQSINSAIPAVGRIELTNGVIPWAGTGWVIADGIIITNRHVADVFAKQDPKTSRFVFRPGPRDVVVSSNIDFLEEESRLDSMEHPITSILWIAPEGEADVAFLRVTQAVGRPTLPRPIELADEVAEDTWIAAIGYPARDPSIRDQQLVIRVFGDDIYDKKRLSLGTLKKVEGTSLKHDCSTLGGNSGSVLLDLKTGRAVGIHRAGLLDDSANLGVPAAHLRLLLKKALSRDTPAPEQPGSQSPPDTFDQTVLVPGTSGTYSMKLHIPIEIIVKVGAPVEIAGATAIGQPQGDVFKAALQSATQQFGSSPDVLKVRSGNRFKNGWITDERVIVIEVSEKLAYGELQRSGKTPFPREIMGVGIDVRTAPLPDQLEALGIDLTALERPGKPAGYTEPPGYDNPDSELFLGRVNEKMSAIFHVSPDAGFPNLRDFLRRVRRHLTATMYEWQPNHISDVIEEVMRPAGRSLRMVTQKRGVAEAEATEKAVEDMKGRIGDKFKHVWASVRGPQRLIPDSYHIKVASRDGEEVWLSSGNWKDSNQPEDPTAPNVLQEYNREWHAIIKNERLATLYQKYIEYDFRQATRFPLEEREAVALPELEFFVPEDALNLRIERVPGVTYEDQLEIEDEELDIQPLLTPDRDSQGSRIFMKFATEMIQRATETIFVQNQSFALTEDNNREFDRFFTVLKEKQQTIRDVRIIFRDAREYHRKKDVERQQELIERLKDFGFDVSPNALRLQMRCHTKGIIVDSKEVMLGSQNLTNGGSLFNRDASLLVRSPKVAAFFEKIFLFDWDNLAHNEADERVGGIRLAGPGEETPKGFRRVKLSELLSEN